jgi:hypothetical protein
MDETSDCGWISDATLRSAAETLTALRDGYAEVEDHVATGVLNAARELLFREERGESPLTVSARMAERAARGRAA